MPDDYSFIYSSWLRGLYYGNDWFRAIDYDNFFRNYPKVLAALFERKALQIKVACLRDQEDVILGFSVIEGTTLHWVFVKSAWRKIGIARDLCPAPIESVSHLTKVGQDLLAKKLPGAIFNPF